VPSNVASEVIRTRTAEIWLDEHGILITDDFPGLHHDLVDAKENVAAYTRLYGGRPRPLLVCMQNVSATSREARTLYSSAATATYVAAVALLVGSPLSRAIGNFFLGLNRSPYPTRLFTSRAEAHTWLLQFRVPTHAGERHETRAG
jgi:hypothetical protein